jgi:hypothetical protein
MGRSSAREKAARILRAVVAAFGGSQAADRSSWRPIAGFSARSVRDLDASRDRARRARDFSRDPDLRRQQGDSATV